MVKYHITELMHHDVYWFTNNKGITTISDAEKERIINLMEEGCITGELQIPYGETQVALGSWEIIDWKNIASELYEGIRGHNTKQARKAKSLFEKYSKSLLI